MMEGVVVEYEDSNQGSKEQIFFGTITSKANDKWYRVVFDDEDVQCFDPQDIQAGLTLYEEYRRDDETQQRQG